MMAATDRICEWDAAPNPRFNLWTIGNSSEVVPGVSPPFFSTAAQQHEYKSAISVAERIGVGDLVPCYPPPAGNWAAVVAGRWALNLAWFNALIGTWQVGGSSGLMEQFITSTEGQDITAGGLADQERALRNWHKVRRIRGALPNVIARDRERVNAMRARERERDLTTLSDRQLWNLGQRQSRVSARLLTNHLHVSLAAGDDTDRLNKLLDRARPGHDPALVIALTSALRDVESARPAKAAWDVARFVTRRKKLAAEVAALAPHEIAERLRRPKGTDWKAFAERFHAFIAEYGFRGQGELDPSTADWEEAPSYALSAIKSYLEAGEEKNPYHLEEHAAQAREAIEAQVGPAIPRELRAEYRELLADAQKFTRMRESSKANWVRANRLLRPPMLELARRLVSGGIIAAPADIFWLIEIEVEAAISGNLDAATARAAVVRRRAEAARLDEIELPEVFSLPVTPTRKVAPTLEGHVLQGMPVSAGTATGRARVVLSADSAMEVELEPGDVLIAPFTDAPWTPLFVPAAAVVVETGGILSHAATVAREFGIPAVVAVKGATRLIKTGQLVTVDGMTGTVTIAE